MHGFPTDGWKAYQRRRGLVADGVPGRKTLADVEDLEAEAITEVLPPDTGRRLTDRDCKRMAGVHPELQAVAHYAIRTCPKQFTVTRTGGRRSAALQRTLFDKGASRKDGTAKKSRHQSGDALDVVTTDGAIDWSSAAADVVHQHFELAAAALGVTLRWGGDWDGDGDKTDQRFHDGFHHERPRGARREAAPRALQWLRAHGIEVS